MKFTEVIVFSTLLLGVCALPETEGNAPSKVSRFAQPETEGNAPSVRAPINCF